MLPHWGGDGRNHVLFYLSRERLQPSTALVASDLTGRALIIQSTFIQTSFRPGFDIVIFPALGPPGGDVWQDCAPMLPARREFLITYQVCHLSLPFSQTVIEVIKRGIFIFIFYFFSVFV